MIAHQLPPQLTSFVGRADDIDTITSQLLSDACRLLTITGFGGIGKTRLAVEVAQGIANEFTDGIYFVDVTPIRTVEDLITTICTVIGFELDSEVSPAQQLLNVLEPMQMLLMLDNFEHLLDAGSLVTQILETADNVKILATSRERLNLTSEWVYPIAGLSVPDDSALVPLDTHSAIQLFMERTQQIVPDFEFSANMACIAYICRLVEGMPLAIELAVSWLRVLTCAEIASEIESGLDVLQASSRDRANRHRSIRTVLDYSWQQLTPDEQCIFSALSVFRGEFSKEEAAGVTNTSLITLSSLVDKSLLRRNGDGRFSLQELVRQFAREKLNELPDYLVQIKNQHSAYYSRFLEQRTTHLRYTWREAMDDVERVLDNIRASWGWMIEQQNVSELSCAIEGFFHFLDHRGWEQEGTRTMKDTIALLDQFPDLPDAKMTLAKALMYLGFFNMRLKALDERDANLNRSLRLFQELGYEPGIAEAYYFLGLGNEWTGELDRAKGYYDACLEAAIRCDEEYIILKCYIGLVTLADPESESALIQQHLDQCQKIAAQLQFHTGMITTNNMIAMFMYHRVGNLTQAKQLLLETYDLCEKVALRWATAETLTHLALVCSDLEENDEAIHYIRQLLEIGLSMTNESKKMDYCTRGIGFYAQVLARVGRKIRSLELLTLLTGFLNSGVKPYSLSFELMETLKNDLSEAEYNAALERGKLLDVKQVARDLLTESDSPHYESNGVVASLTQRELDVMALIAQGLNNTEIADQLYIATSTVKKHINNIFSKLHVDSRTRAVNRARELDIVV